MENLLNKNWGAKPVFSKHLCNWGVFVAEAMKYFFFFEIMESLDANLVFQILDILMVALVVAGAPDSWVSKVYKVGGTGSNDK